MPHQETPILAGEDFTRHVWDETYTMPENQFLAWQRTGNPRYRDLAQRFIFHDISIPYHAAKTRCRAAMPTAM